MVKVFSLLALILIILQPLLVQSKSFLLTAVKNAVEKSFSDQADILQIVIETDQNDNKEFFSDIIDDFLVENWNFRFQIDVNNFDGQTVSDYNLWFIDSYEAFLRLLPWTLEYFKDSQMFYFIVLSSSLMKNYFNVTESIFSDFLELSIANVNVITENTFNGEVLSYTFFPYQEYNCQSTNPILTHQWFRNGSIESSGPFFPSKVDNFNGCPLRIRTRNELILALNDLELIGELVNYDMSLLELILVKEFSARMNFTLAILNSTELQNKSDSVPSQAYELMTEKTTDLVVGFFMLNHLEEHFFSKSVTYCLSWLVICVHPRTNQLLTHGYWLFVAFTNTTWICTVVFFAIVFGCTIVASRYKWLCGYPRGLQLVSFAVGTTMKQLSSKRNSVRLCFIHLSLGSMILQAAYQGKLFDAYRGQKILKSPHSIKELYADNYTICAHPYYRSVIDDINEQNYSNFREIKLIHEFDPFNVEEKLALVVSFGFAYTFFKPEERKKLLLEPILREQICMFFKKHSIFQPKINEIILKMEEAGILPYMRRNYENIYNAGFYKNEIKTEPQSLLLKQFTLTFNIWAVFCGVSFLVFIGELFCKRIQHKPANRKKHTQHIVITI